LEDQTKLYQIRAGRRGRIHGGFAATNPEASTIIENHQPEGALSRQARAASTCTFANQDLTRRMAHVAPPSDLETSAAMRRSLAAGRVGTWHWDIASDAVLWDGALCVVYGLAPAEAPRTAPDFLGLVIPEDRDATVRTVSHGLEGAATIEHRFRASVGGRVFWIYDRAHIIRDRDARSTSVIGMCCDVAPDPSAGIVAFPGPLGDHRPVDLGVYLGTMVESLRYDPRTGAARQLQYEAMPARCNFDSAVKLGLILMELVAPVGTSQEMSSERRITVSLKVDTRSGRLQIDDSGVGRSFGEPRDIGIESAAAFARQLGASLVGDEVAPYSGRHWRLDFPLPSSAA